MCSNIVLLFKGRISTLKTTLWSQVGPFDHVYKPNAFVYRPPWQVLHISSFNLLPTHQPWAMQLLQILQISHWEQQYSPLCWDNMPLTHRRHIYVSLPSMFVSQSSSISLIKISIWRKVPDLKDWNRKTFYLNYIST